MTNAKKKPKLYHNEVCLSLYSLHCFKVWAKKVLTPFSTKLGCVDSILNNNVILSKYIMHIYYKDNGPSTNSRK